MQEALLETDDELKKNTAKRKTLHKLSTDDIEVRRATTRAVMDEVEIRFKEMQRQFMSELQGLSGLAKASFPTPQSHRPVRESAKGNGPGVA